MATLPQIYSVLHLIWQNFDFAVATEVFVDCVSRLLVVFKHYRRSLPDFALKFAFQHFLVSLELFQVQKLQPNDRSVYLSHQS